MKRPFVKYLLPIVVVSMFPALLAAQEFRNNELNVFAGASMFTNNKYTIGPPQVPTPVQGVFKLNDAIRGGVRFNVNTTHHWGEELFFSYEPTRAHLTTGTSGTQEQVHDVHMFNYGVNAMYYIYREESRDSTPYLTAGLGGMTFKSGGSSSFGTSTKVAGNYGIGFKRQLTRTFGFRMDLRGFIVKQPDFGFAQSSENPNVAVFPASGVIHGVEPSVGLYIKFRK